MKQGEGSIASKEKRSKGEAEGQFLCLKRGKGQGSSKRNELARDGAQGKGTISLLTMEASEPSPCFPLASRPSFHALH
ncbi:MAG: hypothetical protein GYA02_00410 [Clostridiaceae bacterium]|nr:hypothetical protein [Clostridiaceae bacterium]